MNTNLNSTSDPSAVKLTPAERRFLEAVRDGAKVFSTQRNGLYLRLPNTDTRTVRKTTWRGVIDKGLYSSPRLTLNGLRAIGVKVELSDIQIAMLRRAEEHFIDGWVYNYLAPEAMEALDDLVHSNLLNENSNGNFVITQNGIALCEAWREQGKAVKNG